MLTYSIRRVPRSRHIRIAIRSGGEIAVTAPKWVSERAIEKIVAHKTEWIRSVQAKYEKRAEGLTLANETVDRREFMATVKSAVNGWAPRIGVKPRKVSIRKMRSRWGSCSREGNISINLLLGHLPPDLLEYVVVHELCHMVHHNHSKSFWSLVAKHLPNHKSRKTLLRRYGYLLRK